VPWAEKGLKAAQDNTHQTGGGNTEFWSYYLSSLSLTDEGVIMVVDNASYRAATPNKAGRLSRENSRGVVLRVNERP
jgi:hypothetical protein